MPIYSTGYTGKSPEDLPALLERLSATVVDVRFAPYSRHEKWRKESFQHLLGERYRHVVELGNRGYNENRIEIVNIERGLEKVFELEAQFGSVVLMCACTNLDECHRALIIQTLELIGSEVVEITDWREDLQARLF